MGIELSEGVAARAYPYLAKHVKSGNVYWLTGDGEGVKVAGSVGARRLGELSTNLDTADDWVALAKGSSFTFTQE